MKEPCDRPCCAQHPDRRCIRDKHHDGDHRDAQGNEWMQMIWEKD